MRFVHRTAAAAAAALIAFPACALAAGVHAPKGFANGASAPIAMEKAASVQTVAARATASGSATIYGGFSLATTTTVYILVRGPSLRTLGVTQNALDAPWTRLYNGAGADLVTMSGVNGFTSCLGSASTDAPVVNHYQSVRREPVDPRDACIAITLPGGVYTFSVTPSTPGVTAPFGGPSSVPSAGEILFEVTLGPGAPAVDDNRAKVERLIGGTWTFSYLIGSSTFAQSYAFTSLLATSELPAGYAALGRDSFGDEVIGSYDPASGFWVVLDPSLTFDRVYGFTFSDLNHVSGCYFQVSPPGSNDPGPCYPMTGVRTPFKSAPASVGTPLQQDRGEAAAALASPAPATGFDPSIASFYQRLRGAPAPR